MTQRVLSPPVLSSILGLIVGSNRILSNFFIPASGILHPIFEAMRTLGNGYLPAVLLVLAGSLVGTPASPGSKTLGISVPARTLRERYKATKQRFGIESGRAFFTQFSMIYLVRFFLMPFVAFTGLETLKVVAPPLYNYLRADSLLLFILLLEACMPSAQNSVTILQLAGDKEGASMMARLLLVIYALGTPAITYWLMKILHYTGIVIH